MSETYSHHNAAARADKLQHQLNLARSKNSVYESRISALEAQLAAERERVRALEALCDDMGGVLENIDKATNELPDDELEALLETAEGTGSDALVKYRAWKATAPEQEGE